MHLARLLPILLLALLPLPACEDPRGEEVRAAYDKVNQAFSDSDGKTAVSLLTRQSIDQADRWIVLAKSGTRDQIKNMPAVDRAEIVRMRNRLTPNELATLDGTAYIILATDRGWFADIEPLEIGQVKFQGSSASASIRDFDGKFTGTYYDFDLVDGVWKLDWIRVDDLFNKLIAEAAAREHTTEDNIILRLESIATGQKVRAEIFDRVR